MSAIRHDRSVIKAYGGSWPEMADAVYEATRTIVAAPAKQPSKLSPEAQSLRERRLALGLYQADLAALLGWHESSIGGIETGHARPSPERWARIEAALAKAEEERDNPK